MSKQYIVKNQSQTIIVTVEANSAREAVAMVAESCKIGGNRRDKMTVQKVRNEENFYWVRHSSAKAKLCWNVVEAPVIKK